MFTGMTKANKLKAAKALWADAVDRDQKWQGIAREDFAFRDGFQWTSEEKQILEEELRPVLTMNLTKSSCDLIMGMNEDTKIVFRSSPAEPGDAFLAEVLNDITEWINERFNFGEEEDAALESAVISGRGFVAIDFLPDPQRFGEIVMKEMNVPVNEVHFDPAARRQGYDDASYFVWDRWLTRADFGMRWPKISKQKLDELVQSASSPWEAMGNVSAADQPANAFDMPHDTDHQYDQDYDQALDYDFYDRSRNMIRVVHLEYWDTFQRYFVFNPEIGDFVEAEVKPTKQQKLDFIDEFGEEMTVETMTDKKVKWLIFAGDRILYDDDSPLPYKGFSVVPVLAYRDVSQRTANHFGIVRLMKDPQKEVNKRWSQTLNMLNQQVQTGVYAETDAFVDKRQAEQSLKEPGSITWVNNGALSAGKLKEREIPRFPDAPMQMEQFSQEIIKKITGINPDLLGQDRGRQEPGVVVKLRQQQGMTLLKPLFNNFNKAKKSLYKRQLAIVMAYMPDAQILRILGQNERYEIDKESGVITDNATGFTAELRDVRNLEYNITSEEAPGQMSKRMAELTALLEMSQTLPVPPKQIIEKMDISASDKAQWLEYIDSQQQGEQDAQEQEIAQEQEQFDREQGSKESKDMMDFVLGISKLKQMAEKDEKSMVKDFELMDIQEQNNIMTMTANLTKIAADANQARLTRESAKQGGENGGTKQATNKRSNAKK
jgi:hypothetical protein